MSQQLISYTYELFFKGVKIGADRLKYVTDIVHTFSSTGSDSLTIKVSDPDLFFIDDNIYTESVAVKFNVSMTDNSAFTFSGYISAIDINFPNQGIPEITIHCMDATYKMNNAPKTRTWKNVKISDVVTQVVRPYGYTLHIDDTIIKEESISQSNQTDIEFIKDLANKLIQPYNSFVSGSHFYFVARRMDYDPSKVISYRKNGFEILSFNPQITKESKKQEITSANISLLTSKVKTYVANDMNVDRKIQGNPVVRK